MLALALSETDIKGFMNKLLREETFDLFEARSVVIHSFARFEITGAPDAAEEDGQTLQKPAYCAWKNLRPYIFNIIKGAAQPKTIKIVFCLGQAQAEQSFPEASALFVNVLFEGGKILVTTGSAQKRFSLDKALDYSWDDYVKGFLSQNGISYLS